MRWDCSLALQSPERQRPADLAHQSCPKGNPAQRSRWREGCQQGLQRLPGLRAPGPVAVGTQALPAGASTRVQLLGHGVSAESDDEPVRSARFALADQAPVAPPPTSRRSTKRSCRD